MEILAEHWRRMRLVDRLLVLALVMLLVLLPAGFVAQRLSPEAGLYACVTAAAICWFGSSLALVLTALLRGPGLALHGLLLGMLAQLGLPLFLGLVLSRSSELMARGGVFGWMVVFHLVGLLVKTVLALPLVSAPAPGPTGSVRPHG